MVVLQIRDGKIRGKTGEDSNGAIFYSFQGIPFGVPPIGKLRFKAPKPVEPWSGIKDATEEGSPSLQKDLLTKQTVGSEDCLNLNVYTPCILHQGGGNLKPVMVWIHGGNFLAGSNKTDLYGPEFLVAEDVVLVTVNYRLGFLGFLSLDDGSLGVPGNAAFKDMVLSLKWVRNNISYFSGDPNNVTVFGESAGAASAHLLMLSPMATGLFQRVIAQSGSALNVWVKGRRSAPILAKELGLESFNDTKILEFLQSVPAEDVLKAQARLDHETFAQDGLRIFGLVLERASEEVPFLQEHPIDIIRSGSYNHVPLIMGYNHQEGMIFDTMVPHRFRDNFFRNVELSVPLELNFFRGSPRSLDIAREMKQFYYGDVELSRKANLKQYHTLTTDTVFFQAIYASVTQHALVAKHPIYFYRLSLETNLNIFKRLVDIQSEGVCHGDDIGYLFKSVISPEIESGTIEDLARRRFCKLWTNFAKFGNPSHKLDDYVKISWEAVRSDKMYFLDIGQELTMLENPEPERVAFWKKMYQLNPISSKL